MDLVAQEVREPQKARPVFVSVRDAKLALASDRLGTVYVRAREVYVVTAHGSGTFPRDEWESS